MNTRHYRLVISALCAAAMLLVGVSFSQTSDGDPPDNDVGGNDSPSGVSGGFNGMVNTGCAYDPYTGNTRRVIDEIIVPGALGAYPLKWSRIYNSREAVTDTGIGVGWRHSYQWSMSLNWGNIVGFPDGREIDFDEAKGISERLGGPGLVLLGDGGQLVFETVPYTVNNQQSNRYRLARIIDPYGLATLLGYETVRTDQDGNAFYRLTKISEPGGRYLKLHYSDASETAAIAGVQAYDRQNNVTQSVNYTYTAFTHTGSSSVFSMLTNVDYSDGTSAQYTYQNDNSARRGSPGIPLLKTCDDVRYPGALRQIEYLFVVGDRIRGKLKSEKKMGTGETVSTLTFPTGRAAQTRVETRGDGPKRTFTYSSTGTLLSYTDFTNYTLTSRLGYDGEGFVRTVKDAGNHQTTYTHEPNIGQVTQLLHPDGTHADFEYTDPGNPYYLWRGSDERAAYVGDPQHSVRYDRDPVTHRVTQINYPDGAFEMFTYDNFGRVTTHRRRNGAYEHAIYNPNGQLWKLWNPTLNAAYPPSDTEPHTSFIYYPSGHPWADRLYFLLDPGCNTTAPGGHWTMFEYDQNTALAQNPGRGLVTKILHGADGTFQSFEYDRYGNKTAQENELRKRTTFNYDDYNRPIGVTPPAPAGPITFTYEPTFGTSNPYLHTARAAHFKTDGAGVTVENKYDENFRVKTIAQLDGTDSPPTTSFNYWPVWTIQKVHDPRNYNWTTTYTYDPRNRKETITDPLNHVTRFHYEDGLNLTRIDRPDTTTESRSYDEMNRVLTQVEPLNAGANKTTRFTYWPSGRIRTVQDDNQQITSFEYDESDLQTRMTYPDSRYQAWAYDDAKNLASRSTVGGKFQWFYYDGRNRMTNMAWSNLSGVSDWASFGYDAANRLTSANNQNGTVTRGYDNAGRLLTEEQNVYGLGAKTVTYGSDAAGKRTAMGLVGTDYQFAYQYDAIGRFEQILNAQNAPNATTKSLWFQYAYDAASNETQRFCPMNGVAQLYERDELGRITNLTVQDATDPEFVNRIITPPQPPPISAPSGPPALPMLLPSLLSGLRNATSSVTGADVPPLGNVISDEHYTYWPMGQLKNISREEPAGASNDAFTYDYSGQLTTASYTGPNFSRGVNYSLDALGNRSQVNDNGSVQGYSPNPNYRNQYVAAPAGGISNSTEHQIVGYDGLSYSYIGDQQLASVTGGENGYYLSYDALGRRVKSWLNGTMTYYTYDGARPIYEWNADGTRAGWNLYGKGIDEILLRGEYRIRGNGEGQGYFFQQNRLGSVTHLTGFAGEPIESYRYDAFGQPTTTYTGGVFNNRFKFTGREYQPNFGIYEYRARAYHPGLGRFLSEDPIGFGGGDANLFRYCGGDPVNLIDPSGLAWSWATTGSFAGAGAISGFTWGVGDQLISNSRGNGFDWGVVGRDTFAGFTGGAVTGAILGTAIGDPSALLTITALSTGGLVSGVTAGLLTPPVPAPPSPNAPVPPSPAPPPYLARPPETPPVAESPDGGRINQNGTVLPDEDVSGGDNSGFTPSDLFNGHVLPFASGLFGKGGRGYGSGIRYYVILNNEL